MTGIYTITSSLHDEQIVSTSTKVFLDSLNIDFKFRGRDFAEYGSDELNLIYVRTGGTEGVFRSLLPSLLQRTTPPVYLLTSGKSNSLAASMEILSYLRQRDIQGEIIHGDADYISQRIQVLSRVEHARRQLHGCRLGIIGKPSDWLISSAADKETVFRCFGIYLIDIPMKEVLDTFGALHDVVDIADNTRECYSELADKAPTAPIKDSLPGALKIYQALKGIVDKYQLNGLTIRCFDLLTTVRNTGCIALAKLNAEGIVAGCEGDVPAMLSMMISQSLTGVTGFQANPARINPETGELLFAHCTIPFNMVERYELDTHFESGIGVGIRGYMKEGPVTIFKVSGNMQRYFAEEGTLLRNQAEADLCRTQQIIRMDNPSHARYFLTDPIGNHHIIIPGHHQMILEELIRP